jgi:clan AA aspartic protease
MGLVHTEITLKNAVDVGKARDGIVKEQEIRQVTVSALVDTGAWTLAINEDVRKKLGLPINGTAPGRLADGAKVALKMAGPLEIGWKNRKANLDALLLPDADEILLGAIPLEAMDLMVDPCKQEVVGTHGEEMLFRI